MKPVDGTIARISVAVFGAGIAGLIVAHELPRRGYAVIVYQPNAEAGGFFRSARQATHQGMPWHGFGPWYHKVFDLMKQTKSKMPVSLEEARERYSPCKTCKPRGMRFAQRKTVRHGRGPVFVIRATSA